MSTDSQLVSHAAKGCSGRTPGSLDSHACQAYITHPTPEQLLRFVTWLFDAATEDGTSSVADHERLIATYLQEIA